MREVDKRTETKAAKATVSQQVNDSLDSWDANYPRTPPSTCGDTVIDTEYGETCDMHIADLNTCRAGNPRL